jgi:hypothetical protein
MVEKDSNKFPFDLLSEIPGDLQLRIRKLLAEPNAGSIIFTEMGGTSYFSNCHGTTLQCFDLGNDTHPDFVNDIDMQKKINEKFIPISSNCFDEIPPGSLLCFYSGDELLHSGLMVGQNKLFEQSGSGGAFEIVSPLFREKVLEEYGNFHWKAYTLKAGN